VEPEPPGKKVLGLFDYTAREAGDVSFKKGDRMLVLSDKYFKFIREYVRG